MATVEQLKGAGNVLLDWFGEGGKPVHEDHAQARAAICLNCPLHRPERPMELLDRGVAWVIKVYLRWKKHLQLEIPNDAELQICDACACVLKLKVWVPIKHIADTMTREDFNHLHTNCWIITEHNKTNQKEP